MANNKHLKPEQYENIIEHMRSRLRRQEHQLAGLDELVKSMDAVLLEISKKYGRGMRTPHGDGWMLEFPKPDVAGVKPGQVRVDSDGSTYTVRVMPDVDPGRWKEEREAEHGNEH